MAGTVSVMLIEVCVLGVVKWRGRMKDPAATKEKEGLRFVSMIIVIMQRNVQLLKLTCDFAFFCHAFLCFRNTTYESADSAHEHVTMEMNPSYAIVSLLESSLKN